MRRTGDVWVALALSAFAVVACSDPHGGTLPTPMPSLTPTAVTPSASNPADLSVATVRYYAELQRTSADPAAGTDRLAALIASSCSCRRVVAFLQETARRGERIIRPLRVTNVRTAPAASGGGTVFITLEQGAGRVEDRDGRTIERLPASRASVTLDFAPSNRGLVITQIAGA